MPRLYPSEAEFAEERRAERTVWEALRDQLPAEAALFHSVPPLEQDREYEIDLLVAWPRPGLAAIEVKGGHLTRQNADWFQESRGHKCKIGSPVVQAQDGKHVLTRYLLQNSGTSAGRCRAAHLVAFPFTAVSKDVQAPDLPRFLVLDERSCELRRPGPAGDRGARGGTSTPGLDGSGCRRTAAGRPADR